MITKEEVLKVAKLARLEFSEAEISGFAAELAAILGYVDQLGEADISGAEPTCFVAPSHDPLRDDVEAPSLPVEKMLANGPSVKKGHFAVPKVIGSA
jgi:aspartyl-tRNA(Asn)/glutamyl-tRNA(Gln) amidotransferase subunit C